jgi:hypothetical protein
MAGTTDMSKRNEPSVDRSELFIAASSDPATQTISLIRGDCQQFVLPFSFFEPSGDGTKPDFSKVGITDSGHTVVLGDRESGAFRAGLRTPGEWVFSTGNSCHPERSERQVMSS